MIRINGYIHPKEDKSISAKFDVESYLLVFDEAFTPTSNFIIGGSLVAGVRYRLLPPTESNAIFVFRVSDSVNLSHKR